MNLSLGDVGLACPVPGVGYWVGAKISPQKDWEQYLQSTIVYCFHSSTCIISQPSKQWSGIVHSTVGQGILLHLPLPFVPGEWTSCGRHRWWPGLHLGFLLSVWCHLLLFAPANSMQKATEKQNPFQASLRFFFPLRNIPLAFRWSSAFSPATHECSSHSCETLPFPWDDFREGVPLFTLLQWPPKALAEASLCLHGTWSCHIRAAEFLLPHSAQPRSHPSHCPSSQNYVVSWLWELLWQKIITFLAQPAVSPLNCLSMWLN